MPAITVHPLASGTTRAHEMDYDRWTRRFLCEWDHCNKRFHRNSDLRRHYRTHTNERPYACTVSGCNKTFSQCSALRVHNRVHTGERPYRCIFPSCDARFSDCSSLARHRRRHKNGKATCSHYRCPTDLCHKPIVRQQEPSPQLRDEMQRTSSEITASAEPDVEAGSDIKHYHMMNQQTPSPSDSTQDMTPPPSKSLVAYNNPAAFDSGYWVGNTLQDLQQHGGGGIVLNRTLEVGSYDCRPPMPAVGSNNQPFWVWMWVMGTDGRHGMHPDQQFAASLAQGSGYPTPASLDHGQNSTYTLPYSEWSHPAARPGFIDSNLLC